jgi:hypothetical protein
MHVEHQTGYTVWRLRWMNHAHVKSFCETIASVGRQCPIGLSFEQQKLIAIVTPYRLDPRFDHECQRVVEYLKQAAPNARIERMHQNNVPTAKLQVTTESMSDMNAIRAAVSNAVCGPREDAICFHSMRLSHRKQNNTCARCLGAGHFTSQCPQTERTCAKCRKVGHIVSECQESSIQASNSLASSQVTTVAAAASASSSASTIPASASAMAAATNECNVCHLSHPTAQCPLNGFQKRASYVTVASSRESHNATARNQSNSTAALSTSPTSPLMLTTPRPAQNTENMDMNKLCYEMIQQTSQLVQFMMQQQQTLSARIDRQDAILAALCKALNIDVPEVAPASQPAARNNKRPVSKSATTQQSRKRAAAAATSTATTAPRLQHPVTSTPSPAPCLQKTVGNTLSAAPCLQNTVGNTPYASIDLTHATQPMQQICAPERIPIFGGAQLGMSTNYQPFKFNVNATAALSDSQQASATRAPLAQIDSNASESTAPSATKAPLHQTESAPMQQVAKSTKASKSIQSHCKASSQPAPMPSRTSNRIKSRSNKSCASDGSAITALTATQSHDSDME